MTEYVIGIDPDCEKSGVGLVFVKAKRVEILTLPFPELLDWLKVSKEILENCIVVVEAGWHNKSNWHVTKYDSKRSASKKGQDVGRNHEVGRKIIEMCKHYGLPVIEQTPLQKIWAKGKISHAEISQFIDGFPKSSNQENRDAALISWNYAGFPIRIKRR